MQDTGLVVDLRGRLGGGGVIGADDGGHFGVHQALRHQCGLGGVAGVVFNDQLDLAPQDAALGIGLLHQHLQGVGEALALIGIIAGHRSLQADFNRLGLLLAAGQGGRQNENQCQYGQ